MVEKELKVLIDEPVYSRIFNSFNWNSKVIQKNYYYSDNENIIDRQGISVRIREVDEEKFLQIKLPICEKKALHINDEIAMPMESIPEYLDSKIIQSIINIEFDVIKRIGCLITERLIFDITESIKICLDKNNYLGFVDYEIEIEYIDVIDDRLLVHLSNLGVCFAGKTKGKYSRFLSRYLGEREMNNIMLSRNASIIFNREIIPYSYLLQRINSIISLLQTKKIEKNVIGIAMHRRPDLILTIYAAIHLKVPFVLIDINLPSYRLNQIVSNAGITTIITTNDVDIEWDDLDIVYIDDMSFMSSQKSASFEWDNNIMYILFTSGSTGTPKGVEILLDGFNNFIDGISEIIDFSPGKRIACLTTVSFDIFFLESIMALYKGLTVVIANDDEQHNPKLMAQLIQNNAVDMIQMTPSRMQLLLNYDQELSCLKNIKEIMIGGEPFPLTLLRTLQQKTTAKIYNMYGPTETTIWSTVSDLTHKDRIDIGRPIKNTEVYIVDESLSILPSGQAGEICIAGEGLAKGYIGNDYLTAEKFICLPPKPETRVYRSGDMGRYLPDGDLEYLGRTDNQVKIRGHRIELEEIESYLNQVEGIKQSVVIALETSETDKILEAFYTSEDNIDTKEISDYLTTKLPSYMMPVIFKHVKEFIQTSNGKIDRNRVFECIEVKSDEAILQPSAFDELTVIQRRAFEVIVSNLNEKLLDEMSIDMDFSSVGFDSITFIKTIVSLEREFDFEFDDEMLLITAFPTVKSMVEYVESKADSVNMPKFTLNDKPRRKKRSAMNV